MEKDISCKEQNHKKTGVAVLVLYKIDLKNRGKEGHFITMMGQSIRKIQTIRKAYTPNDRGSKSMKQKLTEMKGEIDNSIIHSGILKYSTFNNG